MDRYVVTLGRFIIESERQHPGATGDLTNILYDLALAAKLIAPRGQQGGPGRHSRRGGRGSTCTARRYRSSTNTRMTWSFNAMDHTGSCA